MQTAKFLFSAFNYGFYIFYGFTFIDIIKKLVFHEFYLDNAMNVGQLILTIIGILFAYYKMRAYKRDSITRSKILEQELKSKELDNFYRNWSKEFTEPFNKEQK